MVDGEFNLKVGKKGRSMTNCLSFFIALTSRSNFRDERFSHFVCYRNRAMGADMLAGTNTNVIPLNFSLLFICGTL